MRNHLFSIVFVAAMLCLARSVPTHAEEAEERVTQLKAGYLFNFVKFVQWPTATADQRVVCFIGASGVQKAFTAIESKKNGSQRLAIRQVEGTQGAEGCSVLYIDAKNSTNGGHLRGLDPLVPVLTVSDANEFVRNGGMVELFIDRNRLRFNINIDSARRAGLSISSDLLQLAATVETVGEI